jgi:hypothetical protein
VKGCDYYKLEQVGPKRAYDLVYSNIVEFEKKIKKANHMLDLDLDEDVLKLDEKCNKMFIKVVYEIVKFNDLLRKLNDICKVKTKNVLELELKNKR